MLQSFAVMHGIAFHKCHWRNWIPDILYKFLGYNSHYKSIVPSPKTVALLDLDGFFLEGGDGIDLREFFCLFKTARFNIAVAADCTSSAWKTVCALHTGEKFLCKMWCMINFSETAGPGILTGFESLGNAKADCLIISVLPVIHWWL